MAKTNVPPTPTVDPSSPDLRQPMQLTTPEERPAADAAAPPKLDTTPELGPAGLLLNIRTLGRLLDDIETARIRAANQIGALERETGEALPHMYDIAAHFDAAEKIALKELIAFWRQHPLAPWAKSYLGLGEKSAARLVAIVGDPAERPNVAKLWAYCGVGDPKRKRRAGMTQAELFKVGNPWARKQVWKIATSMLKTGNRDYYDARRAKTAERDWTDGHKHADALRYAGKMFLRDLWVAANEIRADQRAPDAHRSDVRAGLTPTETERPRR